MTYDLPAAGWYSIAFPITESTPLERLGVQALDADGQPTGPVLPFAQASAKPYGWIQDPMFWQEPNGWHQLSLLPRYYPARGDSRTMESNLGYTLCVNAAHGVRLTILPPVPTVTVRIAQPLAEED